MKLTNDDLERLFKDLQEWIKAKLKEIGAEEIVLGISGGKDSTVAAAICSHAIGKDKVHGLLMPRGEDKNLSDGIEICESLGINYHVLDIGKITNDFEELISQTDIDFSRQAKLNLPPRVRMTLMYAYAQSLSNALVINTSNLSEDYIGYVTIYGDSAGAFAPLGRMTSDEIIQLGLYMGLEERFVYKPPEDGLTMETDEDIFGFTYEVLNKYIRTGEIEDAEIKTKIDNMHAKSRFKFEPIPTFEPDYIK